MNKKKLHAAAGLVLALGATGALAEWPAPSSVFVEGGVTPHDAHSVSAGVTWALPWRHMSRTGEWTAYAEAFVSEWNAKVGDRHRSLAQLGLVPLVRYRFAQGRSAWFAEGGIGASYFNGLYERDDKRFSTRFNFYDTLGVGRNFGERREHELSLRITHVSNGGIKKPNPGENFVQLRYAHKF